MAEIPDDLLYTEEHEYLKRVGDGIYQVGITDYAQGELGDIVFVELPQPGNRFERKDVFGTVEAVKAVSDLYSPASGEVVEINEALTNDPALVNNDPYGKGWMIKLRLTDEAELEHLLGSTEYAAHVGQ
ncbi:MAG: glycine cleavage system protein GcvH [Longimicrobiales bacterium]